MLVESKSDLQAQNKNIQKRKTRALEAEAKCSALRTGLASIVKDARLTEEQKVQGMQGAVETAKQLLMKALLD